MRWSTYNRAEAKFDQYEEILDFGTIALVQKFMLGRRVDGAEIEDHGEIEIQ